MAFCYLVLTVTIYFLFSQFEVLVYSSRLDNTLNASETTALFSKLFFQLKVVMIGIFGLTAFLFALVGETILGHIKGQAVPLSDQIQHFVDGNYAYRREMRARDELKSVMTKLHQLGDKLQK